MPTHDETATVLPALPVLLFVMVQLWAAADGLWSHIPPNIFPWEDVELDQKPTIFAKLQIARLEGDTSRCFAALDRSHLLYRRMPDRLLKNGCGIAARTNIIKSHVAYSSGFEAPCALVAALYWYEQRLSVAAREQMGTALIRIDHFGVYACRNIYGRAEDRRSAHATARAIDIAGFSFADGSTVSVRRDWNKDTKKARFLKVAHEEACRFFGVVLSPDYNTAHADHMHLELGRFSFCR